ncbi:MAG: hypothetical protein RJQ21_17925 [Rhodospirillales bacterium]
MSERRKIGGIGLPRSVSGRRTLGLALCAGGVLGFLPVVGFWMLPLGLAVLSVDSSRLRHRRRRLAIWWERRRRRKISTQK